MLKIALPAALLTSIAFSVQAQAQTTTRRFEAGLELVNYSPYAKQNYSYASSQLNNKAQWAAGAVFRYHLGQFGLRSGISYATGTDKTAELNNCADCPTGSSTGKELRLRLGGQYSPLTKAPWLYVFSDFYYRRFTSAGNYTGGFCGCLDTDVAVTSNGVGNSTGLGFKIPIWKHFYLNPEVYYDVLRAKNAVSSTDRNLGSGQQYGTRTNQHAPAVRLNAVITF